MNNKKDQLIKTIKELIKENIKEEVVLLEMPPSTQKSGQSKRGKGESGK